MTSSPRSITSRGRSYSSTGLDRRALRDYVGDDIPLMCDGSAGPDLSDAIYVGDALSNAGYLWYEEPMREFSVTMSTTAEL